MRTVKPAIWTEFTVRDDGEAECLHIKTHLGLSVDVAFEKKKVEP